MPKGIHNNHARGPSHPKWKNRQAIRYTPLYRLWLSIRNRCNNPDASDYQYYGGRGITVCPRWDVYELFAADVGPHPGNGLTIDRIDVNKHYEPGNVRWATRKMQARNRNYCKLDANKVSQMLALYKSGRTTQKKLATQFGVTQSMVSRVIRGATWQ